MFKLMDSRVHASDRHCRKMRRNNKFGAKIIIWRQLLVEKKIAGENFCLALAMSLTCAVYACQCIIYLNCQLTSQLSITQFVS